MSDSQFPTDEEIAEALPSEPSDGDDGDLSGMGSEGVPPELPDEYTIGDQVFSREAVEDRMTRWDRMEGAHTRRSQELADERRRLAEREEALARREAELSTSRGHADDDDDPVNQILTRLERIENREVHRDESRERAERKKAAIMQHSGRPLFNYDQIEEYCDRNGLDPEKHSGIAYNALYDRRVGESIGEQNARHRIAIPVMGSTPSGMSPGFTRLGEVPQRGGSQRPVEETSWEELDQMSVADEDIG
jgi:hypothetical protein